jgi:hypothetical protein
LAADSDLIRAIALLAPALSLDILLNLASVLAFALAMALASLAAFAFALARALTAFLTDTRRV